MSDLKAKDVLVAGEDYIVSLSKLFGGEIRDITGYMSNQFGDFVVFSIKDIHFVDGRKVDVAGEHDIAFIYSETLDKFLGKGVAKQLACEIEPEICEDDED